MVPWIIYVQAENRDKHNRHCSNTCFSRKDPLKSTLIFFQNTIMQAPESARHCNICIFVGYYIIYGIFIFNSKVTLKHIVTNTHWTTTLTMTGKREESVFCILNGVCKCRTTAIQEVRQVRSRIRVAIRGKDRLKYLQNNRAGNGGI